MSAALAQDVPRATGLTPGAPLASDPYSGDPIAAGETGPGDQALVGPAADPMVEPVPAEPVLAEPVLAEPVPAEPVGIAQAPIASGPPVALAYPEHQSSAGLTPGAPLGSDPYSDQKAVVGDDLRDAGPAILFR